MGKSSKKLKRKTQQKNDSVQVKVNREAEARFDTYYDQGKYAEALDYLAEMIKGKDIKPDYLYKGAVCYFMQKDYDRAAQWVVNTLNFSPGHVDARILLARVCFQQERADDGLAVLEVILKSGGQTLTDIQQENIEEIVGVYCRNNRQKILDAYPALAGFLHLDKPPAPSDTLAALQKLKNKLAGLQSSTNPVSAPREVAAGQPAGEKPVAEVEAPEGKIREIQEKNIPLAEKIRIYNSFAGAAYLADDLEMAEKYLKAALLLDAYDRNSIRNLAMTIASQGDREKALAVAAKLDVTDFVLLQAIMDICDHE